jgi:hypothetical protein
MAYRITTLFSEPPPVQRGPSSFAVSVLLHCVAFVWLYFALRHSPRINDRAYIKRFTVRVLKQDSIRDPLTSRSAGSAATSSARTSVSHAVAPGARPAPLPSVAVDLADVLRHTQTLVQPDVPRELALQVETPVPLVVRWSPENSPDRTIVLALPKPPAAAQMRPAVIPPNRELTPADIKISATPFSTKAPSLPPSTTSPVVVRRPETLQLIPETPSQSLLEPTPARVISLSDLRLKEGSATIPVANAAPRSGEGDVLAVGKLENATPGGNGSSASANNGAGSGKASAAQGDKPGTGSGAVALNGADTGARPGSSNGTGAGYDRAVTHINLPKDGQFGVVVVGSSLSEQYPEIVNIWGGRLVYTVYLHVGQGKNWILQYSVPRTVDATMAGTTTRPEAPWPYDISRPSLAPEDFNSDAVMVHGFVNVAGHFEKLAIAFPTEFAQAKFVLSALEQWRFRPARQNGQFAVVEVLLIIPEASE